MEKILEDKNQWHPAFYGAAELEFRDNKDDLEFYREYNLSKEPIKMDLMVVKKIGNAEIKNKIGHMFKKYNVLEYKSPGAGMSIDSYFKALGYACMYKGLGKTVDAVPAEEITVSMFREERPRGMFKALKKLGATIEEKYPGVYYVKGIILFDTQIIVTKELEKDSHSSLRILSKKASEDDARRFIEETVNFETVGDKDNAEAVLQVSVSANRELYEKLKEEFKMCQALQDLLKDEIDEKLKESDLKKTIKFVEALMETSNIGVDEAMERLQIPESEWDGLRQKIGASKQ
jgi:hypothetical protein